MARYSIYDKSVPIPIPNNAVAKAQGMPKYFGTFGEVSYLEFKISSPAVINWNVGDFCVYRGVTYKLNDIPQPKKQSKNNTYGEAYVYESMQLYAPTKELECLFRDLVLYDNNIHYTSLPDVSTYEDIYGIAQRIQANLNVVSSDWDVRVMEASGDLLDVFQTPYAFSLSNSTCLEALSLIYNTWKYNGIGVGWIYSYNATTSKHTITIGRASIADGDNTTDAFLYGSDVNGAKQGLKSITKNISNINEIATRLYVYGSERNLPPRYYNKITPAIHNNSSVYIPNLMLPLAYWGTTDDEKDASKAYIDNVVAQETWGIRSKAIYFDGSDDYNDIYPSIEKVTIADVRNAKESTEVGSPNFYPSTSIYTDGTERIDEIVAAENPSDDGSSIGNGRKYDNVIDDSVGQRVVNGTTVTVDLGDIFSTTLTNAGKVELSVTDEMLCNITASNLIGCDVLLELYYGGKCINYRYAENLSQGSPFEFTFGSYQDQHVLFTFTTTTAATARLKGTAILQFSEDATSYDSQITVLVNSARWGIVANASGETFTVTLKQIGFDPSLRETSLTEGICTLAVRDGYCGGREFAVNKATYRSATDDWLCVVRRINDTELKLYFPNCNSPINGRIDGNGNVIKDHFVLLDLEMPSEYVDYASARLYEEAVRVLEQKSKQMNIYEPEIDNLQMQRWVDEDTENHIGRVLCEGMYMHVQDDDIVDGDHSELVLINTVEIDESGEIPQYKVTLRDEKRISKSAQVAAIAAKALSVQKTRQKADAQTEVNEQSTTEVMTKSPSISTTQAYIDNVLLSGSMSSYDNLGLISKTLIERVNESATETPVYKLLAKYDLLIEQTISGVTSNLNVSEILRHLSLDTTTQEGTTLLKVDIPLYSTGDVSAGGYSSGGGGGGTSYDRLDAWADYDSDKAGWVLSALLGNDLNTRLSAIESETMSLSSLTDVDTAGVANGKVLTYNSTTSKWSPQSVATSLATLTDVSISGVSDGQYLYYDSSAAKWKAKSLTSVFQMKGVVATIAELPTGSNIVGDVWHVAENGSEYVYLTSGWEELGTTIDLSGYLPKSAGSTQSLSGDLFVEGYKTGALTTLASIAVISATRTSGTESVVTWGDEGVVSHLAGSSIIADTDISIIQSGTTLKNISEILRHLYLQTTDGITYLGTDLNFFSEQDSAAGGIGSGAGGGGGTAYDRLDAWADYDSDKAGWVLSALLGNDLNSRVGTIEDNYTRPSGSSNPIKYLEVVSDYPATETADTLYLKTGITANSFTLTVFEWSEIGTYAGSESQDEVFSAYAFKQLYDIVQGFTGGEWGSVTANYVPLTIGEVTQNLSIDGHTHSQYALSSTLYNYITTNSAFSNFLSRSLASTGSGNAIVGLSVASDAVTGGYKLQATKGSVGTVTSVGISVPTGLAVSGSPITSSGTIAIALASGYSIPTTAKQTNWDTAYSNYHTHGNKSVLDGITSTKVGNWDTAFSNSHTHDNKSVLDGITSTKVSSWDTAYSNYHAHSSSYSFAANQITCNSIVIGGVTVSVVSGALKVTGNFAASGEVAAGA